MKSQYLTRRAFEGRLRQRLSCTLDNSACSAIVALLLASVLTGCAHIKPLALSPAQTNGPASVGSLTNAELKTFLENKLQHQWSQWPPASWNVQMLTAAASYYHSSADARIERELRGRVRTALLDLGTAQERGTILRRQIAAQKEILRLLEVRVQAGITAGAKLPPARTTLANLEADLARSPLQLVEARVRLASAIGVPLHSVEDAPLDYGLHQISNNGPGDENSGAFRNDAEIERTTALYEADRGNLAALESLVTSRRAEREAAEQQFRAGAVSLLEVQEAELELATAQLARLDAQVRLQRAANALRRACTTLAWDSANPGG